MTHRQCSSILSSFQLKESWRQGHHRASSSPASIWFFSPPAHSPLISPSPLSPPPACRQESRCHPISLLSQSPPCSDLWWHLLSPPTTDCVCWLLNSTSRRSPFWSCYSMFTFPPALFLKSIISRVCCSGILGSTSLFVWTRCCFCQQVSQRNWNERSFFHHILSKDIFDSARHWSTWTGWNLWRILAI